MSDANAPDCCPFRVTLLATGGTIEKCYDARSGQLVLGLPVIESLIAALELPDIEVNVQRLMAKDSLDMGAADRAAIVDAASRILVGGGAHALLITHGTDTLAETAAALVDALAAPAVPVVLTGAMRPYRVADSDAAQNVAQALMAARLLAPGVYAVMHGRVVVGDRVVKDYDRLTIAPAG